MKMSIKVLFGGLKVGADVPSLLWVQAKPLNTAWGLRSYIPMLLVSVSVYWPTAMPCNAGWHCLSLCNAVWLRVRLLFLICMIYCDWYYAAWGVARELLTVMSIISLNCDDLRVRNREWERGGF
jgi:hypothetical protein